MPPVHKPLAAHDPCCFPAERASISPFGLRGHTATEVREPAVRKHSVMHTSPKRAQSSSQCCRTAKR